MRPYLMFALTACYQPPQQILDTPVAGWPQSSDQAVFDPTGAYLALVQDDPDPTITVQVMETGDAWSRSFPDEAALYDLAWSPDGSELAVLGDDTLLRMNPGLATLRNHSLPVDHHGLAMSWDPRDEGIAVLPARQPEVLWLDLASARVHAAPLPREGTALGFDPAGATLGLALRFGEWLTLDRSLLMESPHAAP